jgi:hypothetical protein
VVVAFQIPQPSLGFGMTILEGLRYAALRGPDSSAAFGFGMTRLPEKVECPSAQGKNRFNGYGF